MISPLALDFDVPFFSLMFLLVCFLMIIGGAVYDVMAKREKPAKELQFDNPPMHEDGGDEAAPEQPAAEAEIATEEIDDAPAAEAEIASEEVGDEPEAEEEASEEPKED